MVEGQAKTEQSCIRMFSKSKNAKAKKIKKGDGRGVGGDPIKLMDDFCEETRFKGFVEDYQELTQDQKDEFKETLNTCIDGFNLGDILDRCDYEDSKEALYELRLE